MPNVKNIGAPINLIAHGRSGTSLIQSIFANHPAFDICGETSPLVFGVWHSTERLEGIVRWDPTLQGNQDFRLRCGKAVRGATLETFRNPKKRFWMQKPIGIPWVWGILGHRGLSEDEKISWFWEVLAYSFPEGKNITVLRHPYDVVISAEKYWGIAPLKAWESVVKMARILGHEKAQICHAVVYDKLVVEPLAETERIFDAIDRPFNPLCLKAFEKIWVPDMKTRQTEASPDSPRIIARFSHRSEWDHLPLKQFSQDDRNVITAMWRRYGHELVLKSP